MSSVDKNGRRGYAVFDNSVVYSDNYRNAMINPGSITATGLEFAYDDLGDVVYRYQKGETKAIYEIGMAYLEGRGLLKQDKRKAEEYMKKAADKGDSDALAFFENQKKEAEAAEKSKKEKEAEDDRKALELQKVKKAEYAKKLPGKWKVTRLFNNAYNRMESGLAMTITFKADGTYYAALTYTSPAVKPGVKMTFGVKGVWTVEKGGYILLDDKERYINPQVTYSGGDPHVRYWCNNIAKMTNSENFYIVSGAANNSLVGGTAIFSHQSGNLLTGVKINGNKLTCNYWTARAYDCVMTKIQ